MNRRTALAGLAALAFALPAAAQTAGLELRPRTAVVTASGLVTLEGEARAAALARANQTLNAVTQPAGPLRADLARWRPRQPAAFYLQRPGKLRFEYDPPATMLIVSDGSVVAHARHRAAHHRTHAAALDAAQSHPRRKQSISRAMRASCAFRAPASG